MTILYCNSMDHYGVGSSGAAFDNGVDLIEWQLSNNLNYLGDAFTSDPSYAGPATDSLTPGGLYQVAAPSWGARRGDYALLSTATLARGFSSGTPCQLTGSEALLLAIPGSSQDVRILHMAFSCSSLPEAGTLGFHGFICHFMDRNGDLRGSLGVSPSGRLVLYDGQSRVQGSGFASGQAPNVLSQSASPVISPETWYSLNVKITTNGDATVPDENATVQIYVGDIIPANLVMTANAVAFTNTGTGDEKIDILGLLPASFELASGALDNSTRAIRDIVICDNTGSYNNDLLGQVFVSAQEMRTADADTWTQHPRQNISTGVIDHTANSSANNGIRIADNTLLRIGTNDFTFEGFFRFDALPDASSKMILFSKYDQTNNRREFKLEYNGADDTLRWIVSADGTSETTIKSYPWVPDLQQWYHIAVSRYTETAGQFTVLHVDGDQFGVPEADSNIYNTDVANVGLGARYDGTTISSTEKFDGWIDEVRFTVGSNRYSNTDFTKPATLLPRSVADGDADFANVEILIGADGGSLVDESSNAWTLNLGSNVAAIVPADSFDLYGVLNQRPALDDTFIEAENTFATGILTLSTNPTDGDTMTIGSQTYTFVNSFSTVPADEILIGADNDETITHIVAAVNGGTGSGTDYGTGTSANTSAAADLLPSPQVSLTAVTLGSAGNSVATTETFTAADNVFDNATLTGGSDVPSPVDFSIERLPVDVTGVLGVQITARGYKTAAGTADLRFDLKGPGGTVDVGGVQGADLTPSWLRQVFEEDPDTSATITPATMIGGRVRVTRTS